MQNGIAPQEDRTVNIYITRLYTGDAEPAYPGQQVPEAVYRLTIDGVRQVADRNGRFWTSDLKRLDAAARRALMKAADDGEWVRITWKPQYDSAWAEAADEPCGYVGEVA